ncbi:MAG: hypothetical protein OEX12_16060 [Gammaproteobacteria bacterium]|nr:hypothetical protein [Gammaproteobacteria bacterium]
MGLQVDIFLKDMEDKLKAVVPENLLKVYDSQMLLDWESELKPPFCGVVYAGMTADGTDNRGLSQEMVFNIYVLAGSSAKLKTKNVTPAEVEEVSLDVTAFLDKLRNELRQARAPNSRFFSFGGEIPYDFGKKGIGYVQIWKVKATI